MLKDLFVRGISITKEIPHDSYLNAIPAVRGLGVEPIRLTKRVTFFIGENGAGKSTLIEALAVNMGFNPEGGTRNFNFATRDSHSDLYRYITVAKGPYRPSDGFFLRAESLYNVASNIDDLDSDVSSGDRLINAYGGVSLHSQSHGESFLAIIQNRFGGDGIYILDEPEAALSPSRIMTLMCVMRDLERDNSQFIISTHSPILMTYPDADVLQLDGDGIQRVRYDETEHFQITRRFLTDPDRMIKYLFDE